MPTSPRKSRPVLVGRPGPTGKCRPGLPMETRSCSSVSNTHRVPRPAARGKRPPGFGAAVDGNAWSEDVWATQSGWEAAVKSPNTITMWRSADGLTWTPGAVVAKGDFGLGAHASAPDGTRLLVVYDNSAETSRLLLSKDGQHWDAIDGPPLAQSGISRILAPDGDAQ